MVDWRRLQPQADAPPDWDPPSDGCLRGPPPCAESSGIRAILRAVHGASRPTAAGRSSSPSTAPRTGRCAAGSRAAAPTAGPNLDAYRALIRSLRDVAAQECVAVHWWSPWNEPNHPEFLGPQRAECRADAERAEPDRYANIALAMQAELGPGDHLVLGEAAGYDRRRARAVGAAEFAEGLPAQLVCASDVWAQHAYVRPEDTVAPPGDADDTSLAGDPDAAGDPALLRDVLAALDAKGCERRHRIWITETGVGGPRTGEDRPSDDATDRRSCEAMDGALRFWAKDPSGRRRVPVHVP